MVSKVFVPFSPQHLKIVRKDFQEQKYLLCRNRGGLTIACPMKKLLKII